jgi:hypothetical protein
MLLPHLSGRLLSARAMTSIRRSRRTKIVSQRSTDPAPQHGAGQRADVRQLTQSSTATMEASPAMPAKLVSLDTPLEDLRPGDWFPASSDGQHWRMVERVEIRRNKVIARFSTGTLDRDLVIKTDA